MISSNNIQLKIWLKGLPDNSFEINAPLKFTFSRLMESILEELEWDSDHQFAFYCSFAGTTPKTKIKNSFVYSTYPMDQEYSISKKLSSVDWDKIKNIYIQYDFGDCHWLDCKIVKANTGDGKYKVIRKLKNKIKQYNDEGDFT